jgi:monoterpene epsilon-lactone hydrolase
MSHTQRTQLDAKLRQPGGAAVPEGLEQQRSWFAQFMSTMQVPTQLRVTDTRLGDRRALLVEPSQGTRPGTILYFHGGSFIVGSPETAIGLTGNLVVRSGYPAMSLDYRLAPEHPYPAAVEDAVAAYRELLDLGEPAATIAFVGDSAGGGLAVATALAARDAGLPVPAAIVGFSAGLDLTRTGESMDSREAADPFFTRETLEQSGPLYYGDADPAGPLLSPAVAGDLTGLPPVLLSVGTNEVLLDDSTRFAARAWDQGVDVILDVVAGVPHVFPSYVGELEEAEEALDRVALFLNQRLG